MKKFEMQKPTTSSRPEDETITKEVRRKIRFNSEDTYKDHLEEILGYIGVMGTYQKLLFLATMPFAFFFSFVYFVQMFIAATPHNHWCRVPALQHLAPEIRRNLTAPRNSKGGIEKCLMYLTNWDEVLKTMTPPPPGTPTVPCQYGWEFELKDIPYETVVSERGWVCEYSSYAPTAQSVFFAGSLVGGMLIGWLADQYGRVPALVSANLIGCIGGIGTVFTTKLWDFTICRFLVGMANDNCFVMIYILVLEYVGVQYRTYVANISIALFFGVATMSLPWIALSIGNWRNLTLWTSIPMLIVLLTPFFVPESARWLATKGHGDRAAKMLHRFEKINKAKIPPHVLNEFILSASDASHANKSLKALFQSSLLRLMMALLISLYMCCAIIYDGIVRMSENLGLDFFLTFTLSASTEIFAIILLLGFLDRWGRRYLACLMLVLTGLLLFVAMFVPKGVPQVSLAIMARLFANVTYNTLFQWATELLPTGVRASGSALVHVSGYVATVLSPFIVYSERLWESLPLLILGLLSLVGFAVGALMPETMGRPMPQTFADGERLVEKYSLCGKFIIARQKPSIIKAEATERENTEASTS